MNNSNLTQCDRILRYIRDFGEISQLDALRELGVMRLASRISEMRKRGIKIEREMRSSKNRYGENVSFAVYKLSA